MPVPMMMLREPVARRRHDDPVQGFASDEIVHVREWGTGNTHLMPHSRDGTIGSARGSWIRLAHVAREHARISRVDGYWVLKDMSSSSGIRLDGVRHSMFSLVPGCEIEIGDVTLVAESRGLAALRDVLVRLLGWAPERVTEVDLAVRAVRMAALHREPLFLCGSDGDVLSAARLLHQHTLGSEHPFITCAPRRILTGRKVINIANSLKALKVATGGTLCIWPGHQLLKLVKANRPPTFSVQLIVCGPPSQRADVLIRSRIVIPSLRRRKTEMDRIINEYLVDARTELGGTFLSSDHTWIRRHDAKTLSRIELATRRLVALRSAGGSITRAARLLGIAHSALSEWVARRKVPDLVARD